MSFIAKNPLSLPEINYTPSTPSGTRGLFPKSDGWYSIDKDGVEKKLLDLDDMKGLERLQYYGDANIIPTDESYFEIGNTEYGTTIYLKQEYRYNDILTEVVIPYKSDTEIIKAISDGGFESFGHKIKKIILPNTIVSIGSGAFNNCVDLIDVNIPNSVTEICSYAFYGCSSLTQLILPDSILRIGDDAFDNCSSDLTIICSQGSVADTYAKENRIKVKYDVIDADSLNNSSGGTGAVSSVNRKVGDVVLSAEDVGAYTKEEINSKLSAVYRYKGAKDYYFELPTENEIGDVYNIRYASGENHISEKPKFTFTITENIPEENMYSIVLKPIGTFNVEHLFSFGKLNVSFGPVGQGDSAQYGFTSNIIINNNSENIEFYVYGINHSLGGSFDPSLVPGGDNIVAFINEDLPDITLEEPYRVKDGDNVAWTGTEWDVLGGTEDMSLYAQTNLSNVDNATFKAKAESAGVGGGSGGGAVSSVNGQIGEVELKLEDINDNIVADESMFQYKASESASFYFGSSRMSATGSTNGGYSLTANVNGLSISGNPYNDNDITLVQNNWVDENDQSQGIVTTTHKLSEKADKATTLAGYGITDGLSFVKGYEDKIDYYHGKVVNSQWLPVLYKIIGSKTPTESSGGSGSIILTPGKFNEYYLYAVTYNKPFNGYGDGMDVTQIKLGYDGLYIRKGHINGSINIRDWGEWKSLESKDVDLSGYYTKDEINSKLSSIYRYKGTKDYYFQLPTENEIGDVYNIIYASGEYYNTDRPRSYNIDGVVSLDVYWSNANGIFITVDYDNNKNNLYTQHFEGKNTIKICINNFRLESVTSFTLPILKGIPAEPTSGVYLDTEFCKIFINANDPNFSKAYEGDSQYETYYDYILAMLNGWSEDTESIHLYFNNEYQYILSEPYLVKDGDNVVWNGTGWDVLGGTWDGLKQIIKENVEQSLDGGRIE